MTCFSLEVKRAVRIINENIVEDLEQRVIKKSYKACFVGLYGHLRSGLPFFFQMIIDVAFIHYQLTNTVIGSVISLLSPLRPIE